MTKPPRLAEAILHVCLPKGLVRDSVLGDLEADFHRDLSTRGRRAAVVGYWGTALAVALRYLAERALHWRRVGTRATPRRDTHGRWEMMGGLVSGDVFQDIRYAVRTLAKEPGWTAATLATLALGIGATTAIFTIVNAVLVQPLAFPEPDRLMMLEYRPADPATDAEWAAYDDYMSRHMRRHVTYPAFETWREATADLFTELGAYDDAWSHDVGFGADQGTERLPGTIATAGLFQALGVSPLRGRLFTDTEDSPDAPGVILLSHGLWMRRFGGDPDAVGSTVTVRGQAHTIVGVMPSDFAFPEASTQLWLSMATGSRGPGSTNYQVVGRVADGTSVDLARMGLNARQIRVLGRDEVERRFGADFITLHSMLVGEVRPLLMLFMSAVGVLLLIACVNVVNLMLSRAVRREHDQVVRAALGAGPARLSRQLLTESLVVSIVGAGLGLVLAFALVSGLMTFAPGSFPRQESITVDGTVIIFSLVVATLVGILVGIVPALRSSRSELAPLLNEASRGSSTGVREGRLRDGLVVLQLAMALVLLVGGGLLTRSLTTLLSEETGFDRRNVLTFETSLPGASYPTFEERRQFYDDLLAEVRALPGVQRAAVAVYLPASGSFHYTGLVVEGYQPGPDEEPMAEIKQVSPDYFATMGMRIVEGRPFDERDDLGQPRVLAISESLARSYFPQGSAIGGRILLDEEEDVWGTVVAVVGDVWFRGGERRAPALYEPYAASGRRGSMDILAKVNGEPLALVPAISRLVTRMNPDIPVYGVMTLEARLWSAVAAPRLRTLLIGAFSIVSLLLSVVGVYGVMAYMVGQRTRELGIRRVLGAAPGGILRYVVRRGVMLTAMGIAVGVVGALQAADALQSYLYDIQADDPVTIVAAATVLAIASMLACSVPALRAARVDPLVAMRNE